MDLYHVLNRGVEKRDIVLNDGDRQRFVRSLYVFNDSHSVPNGITQKGYWEDMARKRDCLVNIHSWCLMDNHYHLLVSPVNDDLARLSLFMKKLNMGYAKFFNEKYDRSGYLWQGRYKKIAVERDAHFLYLPYYIHLNPLDYKYPEWRSGNVTDFNAAIATLKGYRWSSYFDYSGTKNFPSLINKSVLGEILGSEVKQSQTIKQIVADQTLAAASERFEL
ncbi:MAG: putative transposase [Candidatus Azotimanducaceae bacterium]|jgi:putative transposase